MFDDATSPTRPPRYLYKYRPINKKTAHMLRKGKLYFSTPEKLNDPLECKPVLTTTFTETSFRKTIRADIAILHPEYTNIQLEAELERQFDNLYPPSPDKLEEFKLKYRNRIEKIGIFSLCERYNSIVMWSHYAEEHRGICLELDTELLPDGTNCLPVVYSGKRPIINLFSDREDANIITATTKTDDWNYEEEWRIVKVSLPNQPDFPRPLDAPKGFIHAVIFGTLIKPKMQAKVIKWIKKMNPVPKIYETELDKQTYRIIRRPVSI